MRMLTPGALLLALPLAAAAAPAPPPADAAKGKTVFARCAACHSIDGSKRMGPTLAGVSGRKAGAVPGFNYSKPLAASGLVWNDATLDRFLAAPTKVVPGTKMVLGVPQPQDRADLIAFLKAQPKK